MCCFQDLEIFLVAGTGSSVVIVASHSSTCNNSIELEEGIKQVRLLNTLNFLYGFKLCPVVE
jgi:hypothetical protein